MYISFRGEEGVQQVPTIVRDVLEEFVIGRGADTGKRWRRGGAVAEPGHFGPRIVHSSVLTRRWPIP